MNNPHGHKKPSEMRHWDKGLAIKGKQKTLSVTINPRVLFCRDILYRVRCLWSAPYCLPGQRCDRHRFIH
jgi:hypothetical protein